MEYINIDAKMDMMWHSKDSLIDQSSLERAFFKIRAALSSLASSASSAASSNAPTYSSSSFESSLLYFACRVCCFLPLVNTAPSMQQGGRAIASLRARFDWQCTFRCSPCSTTGYPWREPDASAVGHLLSWVLFPINCWRRDAVSWSIWDPHLRCSRFSLL